MCQSVYVIQEIKKFGKIIHFTFKIKQITEVKVIFHKKAGCYFERITQVIEQ